MAIFTQSPSSRRRSKRKKKERKKKKKDQEEEKRPRRKKERRKEEEERGKKNKEEDTRNGNQKDPKRVERHAKRTIRRMHSRTRRRKPFRLGSHHHRPLRKPLWGRGLLPLHPPSNRLPFQASQDQVQHQDLSSQHTQRWEDLLGCSWTWVVSCFDHCKASAFYLLPAYRS